MNILVATISVLTKTDLNDYKIKVDGKEMGIISAVHTNESIVKAVEKLGVKIDKIIALCSDMVQTKRDERFGGLTALEYYTQKVQELYCDIDIVKVQIDNRQNSEILSDICNEITTNDIVYLDIAGGQRTIANIIQLLAKVLQYKGIKNPLSLYADFQNADKFIVDTHEFTVMTNIADAINEFVSTGKSVQLNRCLENVSDYTELLKAMNDFSEKIMLCDIGKLDSTLSALKESIDKINNNAPTTIVQTIIKQLLPIISEKLFVGHNNVDYKQIINWCLKNGLIQQAVTIYIEKMPVYYFQKEILKDYVDLEKITPTLGNSKETAGFYDELFNNFSGNSRDELLSEFQIFVKKVIDNNPEMESKKLIRRITEQQQDLSGKLIFASNSLISFIKKQYSHKNNLSTSKKLYTSIAPKQLKGFLHNLQITPEYHHFFVYNDKQKWENRDTSDLGTYEKKVKALQKVQLQNQLLYNLMSHYLALKIMRNRMNHASETIFTEDEKIAVTYLQSIGFNIDFSISAITKIIESGLKIV